MTEEFSNLFIASLQPRTKRERYENAEIEITHQINEERDALLYD